MNHRILPDRYRERAFVFARFVIVGLFSAGLYAIIALAAARVFGLLPWIGSAVAYITCIPINYLLQRYFTFRSGEKIMGEVPRYLITHLVNLSLSTLIVYTVVERLNLPLSLALFLVVIVVPLLQFLVLENWVFSRRNEKKLLP